MNAKWDKEIDSLKITLAILMIISYISFLTWIGITFFEIMMEQGL